MPTSSSLFEERKRARKQRLLHILLAATVVGVLIFVAAVTATSPQGPLLHAASFLIFYAILALAYGLSRRGRVTLASHLFLGLVVLWITGVIAMLPTALLPILGYALCILMASVLIHSRASFAYATLAALLYLGVTRLAEPLGLPPATASYALIPGRLLTLYIVALIAWLFARSVEQALAEADQRTREIAALASIAHVAGRPVDRAKAAPDESLQPGTEHVTAHLTAMLETALDQVLAVGELQDRGAVFLLDEAAGVLRLAVQCGLPPDFVAQEQCVPLDACLCGQVALAGELRVILGEAGEPHCPRPALPMPHGHIVVPLKAGEQVLGVMSLYTVSGKRPAPSYLQLLTAVGQQVGLAVENAQLYARTDQTLQTRVRELEFLHQLGARITASLSLDEVLAHLTRETAAALCVADCCVSLLERDALRVVANWVDPRLDGEADVGDTYPLADYPVLRATFNAGDTFRLPDPEGIRDLSGLKGELRELEQWGYTCTAMAPLLREGQSFGVLEIYDDAPGRGFDDDEVALLEMVARQAAVAIEKVRLYEAEQRRVQAIGMLLNISETIGSTLELPRVLDRIVLAARKLLPVDRAVVFLWDEASACLVPSLPRPGGAVRLQLAPEQSARFARLRLCPEEVPIVRELQVTRQAIALADAAESPLLPPGWAQTFDVCSLLVAPLVVGGGFVGALYVDCTRQRYSFSPDEIELGMGLARQAALALERARLFEAVHRQVREAETLRQAGAAVAATLRQEEAIERILEQLARVVPYDSASVQLLVVDAEGASPTPDSGGDEGYLEIVGGRGWAAPAVVVGLRFPIPGDNPNTVVIQQRRPHILGNAPTAHAPFREDPHSHIRSWLGVPLIVHERVIGMLAVDSARPDYFAPEHARLVTAFADQVAIAIENARLYTEAEQRATELSTVLEAARMVSSTLDLKEMLALIARQMVRAIGVDGCTISRWDREADAVVTWLEWRARWGEWADEAGTVYALDDFPATRTVLETRQPVTVLVTDPDADPAEVALMRQNELVSLLMLPLVVGQRAIGLVELDESEREREFTVAEIRLCQALADQAALAIENARLYQSAVQAAERRAILHRASQEIGASLYPEQVYAAIHQATAQMMPSEAFVIALLDESRQEIEGIYLVDRGGRAPAQRIPASRGLSGHVVATGEPLRVGEYGYGPVELDIVHFGTSEHVRSILAVPMRLAGKVTGVLSAQSYQPHAYTADDQELLELLAAHAAIALDNARLFGEVQRLAVTDELTGLANRRAFDARLAEEIRRARRYERPLALVMADIDHFKHYNDTHGHPQGDVLLRELASVLRSAVRETDFAARYGGEEFVMILPETNRASALTVAEKVRAAVTAHLFPLCESQPEGRLTISLGVATFPEDLPEPVDLVQRADDALYCAKREGRNRVC